VAEKNEDSSQRDDPLSDASLPSEVLEKSPHNCIQTVPSSPEPAKEEPEMLPPESENLSNCPHVEIPEEQIGAPSSPTNNVMSLATDSIHGSSDQNITRRIPNLDEVSHVTKNTLIIAHNPDVNYSIQDLQFLVPFIKHSWDPPADGNCGFYSIAKEMGHADPMRVRNECINYLQSHQDMWSTFLGGLPGVTEVLANLNFPKNTCTIPKAKWFSKLDTGPLIPNVYERPLACIAPNGQSHTFFPHFVPCSLSVEAQPPMYMLFTAGCHWQWLDIKSEATDQATPLPPPFPGWQSKCQTSLEVRRHWMGSYSHHLNLWQHLKKKK